MYQSFTGTSRRPRQVNLSGRASNPFTKSNAIASAHEDRLHRQQQREELSASSRIQKVWRGHSARRRTFKVWRQIWDAQEEKARGAYTTADDSLRQLWRLMLFFSPRTEPSDVQRLAWYGTRQVTTSETVQCEGSRWKVAYSRLQRACISALKAREQADLDSDRTVLGVLAFAARKTGFTAKEATDYYETLTNIERLPAEPLEGALLAPLSRGGVHERSAAATSGANEAYAGLVVLLARPLHTEMLSLLRAAVHPQPLVEAVAKVEQSAENAGSWSVRERLWLLGNTIFLAGQSKSLAFVIVVSRLLGSLADDVVFEGQPLALDNSSFDRDVLSKIETALPLNEYLREQVTSLIDQGAIRNLLSGDSKHAQALSGYALTLLRSFPRRGDEIRMWLHRGSMQQNSMPPTHYLWEAAKGTSIFGSVKSNSRAVLSLLKSPQPSPQQQRDDWTIILVFLELYGFDLKIMDDEEFMGSSRRDERNNAVPLADVAQLVTFLKNLGFTLYFNASDLNNSDALPERDAGSINLGRHFGSNNIPEPIHVSESKPLIIAGLPGLTVDYLKGIVTGLLRAIYERDSRRSFLPKDHWLMTDRFDMTSFIPGVVAEEESRHTVQEQDDEEKTESDNEEDGDSDADIFTATPIRAAGHNYHARVLRSQQARARAQRKARKKRQLEAVAPRLEILQNLPFFIPFHTRVQIFRQFVQLDQEKRRNGFVDPDMWRQSMMFQQMERMASRDPLARHHAQIKRKQEFSDAFDAFYELGADLKEPIQITFVDEFDMPEAGIDGGGVTKEFLTSVITQAFDRDAGHEDEFFIENESHVLYPNPNALEDLKLRLRRQGYKDNSLEMRDRVRELLKRFEFLGRVIGKCLYEGILIDVSFAGFFLKKWPLFGGGGSGGTASLESGYRANINDVRELDEDLYRGLLALKNADDAEQLSLSMSVNNIVGGNGPGSSAIVVEHDLVPHGSDVPVTNENRLHYISRLAWYRLQGQSAAQTHAFLRGLAAIILPSWLSMFNPAELQTLIGGAAAGGVDVNDLRRHTLYGGTYVLGTDGEEHPSVRMFWDVMEGMEDADRRKVLKFVTSTPRGPLLGFAHLTPRFSIRDAGSDENRFPTTSTCVNLLKLPMYRSKRRLREKLLAAVNSGAGFDLS